MRKITIILACILCQLLVANAAKLPSEGYEGPYQHVDEDYGNLMDYDSDQGSAMSFTITGSEPLVPLACPSWGYVTPKSVCVSCVNETYKDFDLSDDPNYPDIFVPDDPCYILDALGGQTGASLVGAYEQCANSRCGGGVGNCDGPRPPLGCPVGTETPLIFFALSLLAMRIWRKKKDNIINEK